MSKMIQIRNVPDEVHRKLKARAALAGMSLSDFLLAEIELTTSQPTLAEIIERLKALEPIDPAVSTAELVREERDSR